MSEALPIWSPRYTITSSIARRLMEIEAARAVVERTPAGQVAQTLGLSQRMARNLVQGWVDDGLLVVVDASKRKRAYGLSAVYRQYVGSLSAMTPD